MSILQSSESSIKSERPKIPIPRWGKSRADQDISYRGKIERRRVTHACEPCREKKTKCDGGRPMCYHCRVSGIPCYYGDGKRERARKNLRMLESRIVDLEGLIQDIQPHLNNTGKLMVKGVLSRNPAPSLPIHDSTERPLSARGNDTTSNYQSPRQHSAGSLSQSFMPEDIGFAIPMSHQIKGVHTEFVISQSECAEKGNDALWIQHGDQGFESDGSNTPAGKTAGLVPSYDTPGTTLDNMRTMDSTQRNTQDIFNGDQEISSRSRQVDTFSLPPKLIAERLIDSYFNTVHPLFPIIYKPHFMTQFNKHYGSSEGLLEPTACQGLRKWLTILNLVFAIAEKYLQSELGTNIGDQERDTDYFARSRILGALDGGSVFQIPDLGRIQALGLTSMYLLASIQTNRAWNVAGLAIRLAHAIGLHLRGDIISGDLETIMRSRTWYCLYYLETTLCLITGRPCAIQDRNCTAPHPSNLGGEVLPAPYSEAAVLDTYFSKHQTLMAISADMLSALYSEKCFRDKSWPQVQGLIAGLSTKLENWRAQLPLTLDFFREEYNQLFKRQRLNLAFQYHTVLMLINRPCLSKVSSRKDSTPDEPPELGAFNKMASEACISSARAIIHLIVKGYKSRDLVPNSPWWSLIHHLIPAKKVIMLEVTDGGPHLPEYRATLLDDCRMVLTWLRGMSKMNTALQRHSLELSEQLQQIAPEIFDQFGEVVVYGPENVLPQFILSSTAQPVSILPQYAEHRGLQFDAYGKACYDTHYRFLDSKNTRVCSSSYQPGRDTMIMAESPISVHSRPTDNPQADNTNLWLDAYI